MNMRRVVCNKTVSVILLFSIVLSIASCSSDNSKRKKVSADSPWYDAEIIDFKPETRTDKQVSSLYNVLAGSDEDYIVVYSDGDYRLPDDADELDYRDSYIELVTLIDRSTKQNVKTLDLTELLGGYERASNVNYVNGIINVYGDSWDPETNITMMKEFEIDPVAGEVINSRDISIFEGISIGRRQYSYSVGEYRILPDIGESDGDWCLILRVISPDGKITEVPVKDPAENFFSIVAVFALDEKTALIPVSAERGCKYFLLDLNTYKLSQANSDDYSWLGYDDMDWFFNSPDGDIYISTTEGVSKIDFKNKKIEKFFDYNSSKVSRNYTSRLEVADCTEDKILLCGSYYPINIFQSSDISDFVIIELTKADKNPNAGKTILEMYIPEHEVDGIISDSIIKYNETNSKYVIQITDRYNDYPYLPQYDQMGMGDVSDASMLEGNNKLSYNLAMDIMNGEGPDILMDTSGLAQLNNDNYLVDLSTLAAELGPDSYYTNIIDGARTDGKLYQLPVCYTIRGIQTDMNNAGASGTGFTTEEYEDFLYGTLNGSDIIGSSQPYYFALLFNNMADTFIKDGKVDLTGAEFEALARYVKDNVQQSVILPEDDDTNVDEIFDSTLAAKNHKALYCNCPGISGYLVKRARVQNATSILGLPSADGRGPMFGTNVSVAVSANAVNKDACIEFVKMLLTDDIQSEFASSDYFVLNRNALRQCCSEAVKYYNGAGKDDLLDYTLGSTVSVEIKFTEQDVDNLEKTILSCSKSDCIDSAINMILIEEMPAYFSGQKDLASVISVLQDRIQKILDERR